MLFHGRASRQAKSGHASSWRPEAALVLAWRRGTAARRLPLRVTSSVESLPEPPTVPGSLPILEDLLKVDLRRKAASHHRLLNEAGQRVLQVRYLGNGPCWCASPRTWLRCWAAGGAGGAAARRRSASTRGSSACAPGLEPASAPLRLEAQELLRRYSLDVLGLTVLRADLGGVGGLGGALREAALPGADAGHAPLASPDTDLVSLVASLEASALWLLLGLPLPDPLLPGYGAYTENVAKLDQLVYGIIRQRRERGVGPEDRDLLAFLLRAQQRSREAQQAQQAQQGQQGQQGHSGEEAGAICPHAAAAAAASGAAQQPSSRGICPVAAAGASTAGTGAAGPAGGGVRVISDQQIRDELVVMFFGGTDTSATTLAFAAHHLAHCPHAQAAAREEVLAVLAGRPPSALTADDTRRLPLLAACISETLRLYPAVPELTRIALRDQELGGCRVTRGSTAVACLYSLHRHPAIWPRPEEWLPQRWLPGGWPGAYWAAGEGEEALGAKQPNAFLPFGVGPRNCIGRHFALLSMQLTLAALLSRVELLPDPAGPSTGSSGPSAGLQRPPLDIRHSITLRAANGVWLGLRPL